MVFDPEKIKQFIKDWREDPKSELEPVDNPGPIYKIVGKTFQRDVLDNDDDIVLNIYESWCQPCSSFDKVYENIAESFSDYKKLKFAKVDIKLNYIKNHLITEHPTLKVFPGKDKSKSYIYSGNYEVEDIKNFIKEKISYSQKSEIKTDL